MGLAILYNAINAQEGMSCERAYLPWKDMSALMRQRGVPMLSLEGAAPLASFDSIGFTLAHELIWTNILEALDLAGIALDASERDEDDAIVLARRPLGLELRAPRARPRRRPSGRRRTAHRRRLQEHPRLPRAGPLPRRAPPAPLAHPRASTCPPSTRSSMTMGSTRWGRAVPREGTGAPPWSPRRVSPTSLPRRPSRRRSCPTWTSSRTALPSRSCAAAHVAAASARPA